MLPHLCMVMLRPRPSPYVIDKMSPSMERVFPMGSILRLTCILWEQQDLRSLGVFVGVVPRGGVCVCCRGKDPVESVGPRSKLRVIERPSFTYLGLLNKLGSLWWGKCRLPECGLWRCLRICQLSHGERMHKVLGGP